MVEIKIENFEDGKKNIILWTVFPDTFIYTHHQEFQVELHMAAKTVSTTNGVSVITYRNSSGILRRDVYIDGVKAASLSDIGGEDVRPSFHEPLYTGGPCGIYITSDKRPDRILFGSQEILIREDFIEIEFNAYKDKISDELRTALIGFAIRNPSMVLSDTNEINKPNVYYYPEIKDLVSSMRKYAKYYV